MKSNIDAVILFVDMNDPEWRAKYNNYIEIHEIPNKHINNEQRFRDYGSLKAVLRSIDLYAPWINNVFLVVQSESQVPTWVNREMVKIVLHEEFIPKEFLPTFNCNTIETHLHFIPGLSEKFIYFNDDTLLTFANHPEDYFVGDKCIHYINIIDTDTIMKHISNKFYQGLRFSNTKELHNLISNIHLDYTFRNSHGPTPLLKSICDEIYNKINIKDHMSCFRETKNLTQELFTIYALYKRKFIHLKNSSNSNKSTYASLFPDNGLIVNRYTTDNHITTIKNLFNNYKTFCMNDIFINNLLHSNDFLYDEIEKMLLKRFPDKSKYEL